MATVKKCLIWLSNELIDYSMDLLEQLDALDSSDPVWIHVTQEIQWIRCTVESSGSIEHSGSNGPTGSLGPIGSIGPSGSIEHSRSIKDIGSIGPSRSFGPIGYIGFLAYRSSFQS